MTQEQMPSDANIMPRIHAVSEWVLERLAFIPSLGLTHGDHLPTTGAEAMLSEHLDDLEPPFNTSGR